MGCVINMNKKNLVIISIVILFAAQLSFAADPRFYKGYVYVNDSLASNGTVVQAFVNGASSATSYVTVGNGVLENTRAGWYTIGVEANVNDTLIFKVNGVAINGAHGSDNTTQTIQSGQIVVENFNLSINKTSDGVACTYASGCSNNYCVHSYCRSSSTYCGDGYCDAGESCSADSTACDSGYACTSGCVSTGSSSSGGGSGGGGATTVESTVTVPAIDPNVPATFDVDSSKTSSLKVDNVTLDTNEAATGVQITVKDSSLPTGANLAIGSDGLTYKYLSITSSLANTAIDSAKISFKVEKSWLISNNIDVNTIALNRYSNNIWTKLPTTLVSQDSTYYYFEATTPGFSTFAITGQYITTALCGNGNIDSGEQCDGIAMAGQTCVTKGFVGGTLQCTNCMFDTSACTGAAAVCGNDIIEGSEPCDGMALAGQTCVTMGFDNGTLKCTNCAFDTSACVSVSVIPVKDYTMYAVVIIIIAIIAGAYWFRKKPKSSM